MSELLSTVPALMDIEPVFLVSTILWLTASLLSGCWQELKELSEEERKKLKAEAKKKARSAHSDRQHLIGIQGKLGEVWAHFDWALGNLWALEQ
eukprot:COSAG04_NODE_881_length_9663_cov_30.524258_1_plen_94_part_00